MSDDNEVLELITAELEARSRKAASEMEVTIFYNIYNQSEESEAKDDD